MLSVGSPVTVTYLLDKAAKSLWDQTSQAVRVYFRYGCGGR